MAFATLEDMYGSIEMIVFPTIYSRWASIIKVDNIVLVRGHISIREGEEPKLICDEISNLPKVADKGERLYVTIPNGKNISLAEDIKPILRKYRGPMPVYLYDEGTKHRLLADKKLWVRLDFELLNELKKLLGEDYVKVV